MRTLRTLAAVGLVALLLPLGPAVDAQTVLLKTNYPSVVVEAGKSVDFDIDVITGSARRVDLAVTELPGGFQATLRGGGFVISGVFGEPENPPEVTLEVKVPPDAAAGDHRVVLQGSSAGVSDSLVLHLIVAEGGGGAVDLSAEFPAQRGSATENFTFQVTLENNTPEETAFSLEATGPPGWIVDARPTAETNAATIAVEGGGEAELTVTADPPDGIAAESYPILVRALGGAGKTAELELTAEITGSTQLELTTSDERLNREGQAGDATEIVLAVRNTGTTALQNVSISSTPPTGWEVSFSPETVEQVPPGETAEVTAQVVPSGEAVAGDYTINFTATGGEGGTDSAEIRFTVETSRFWGLVGILVIVGALFALRWVFQRYGRR